MNVAVYYVVLCAFFACLIIVPVASSVSKCYYGKTEIRDCVIGKDKSCFSVKCEHMNGVVKGCAGDVTKEELLEVANDLCQQLGTVAVFGSEYFCYADSCNKGDTCCNAPSDDKGDDDKKGGDDNNNGGDGAKKDDPNKSAGGHAVNFWTIVAGMGATMMMAMAF